jgi:LacI family transcriptional regulator
MRQFGASERSVRGALDELRRQGVIVRRQGARTYVADPNTASTGSVVSGGVETGVASRTVVAIAIPDQALFDQAMKLLVEQAKTEDVSVLCHLVTGDDAAGGQVQLPQLSEKPLGFIIFRRELLPLAEQLHAAGHRVVLVGTPYAGTIPAVPVVCGNQAFGGYLATKHLISLGHRRIAICAYGDWRQTLRGQGYERALREASRRGLEIEESFVDLEVVKDDPASLEAVFHGPAAPTGLVVWNDHEAAFLVGVLNRLNVRIPRDVSIVGYDNLREGQILHPALTTVYSSMEQQLQAALNLLAAPAPPPSTYQLVIQPSLVYRESTAAPASQPG